MNSLSFLSPTLLFGMLAACIPIIIHLLYRKRFIRVDWAPMRYLKLSIQRNRRRVRIEQLLLLLLRVSLILLLFFIVARPVLFPQGLGAWMGGQSRTSKVLVLDDSLSMGFLNQGKATFVQAQDLAIEILKTIGPKDRLTLMVTSQPKTPLLRDVEIADRDQVAESIRTLKIGETYTRWDATLNAVNEVITTGTYPIREVVLITDLRHSGWDEKILAIGDHWADSRVRLRIFDLGSEATENLVLETFRQTNRVALVGAACQYEAVIRNDTQNEQKGLEATLTIDGKPGLVQLPPIPAGASVRVPVHATFQEPGAHEVSFRLPDDALAGDNQRWAVTTVVESLRLLLVDGEPAGDSVSGEVDFLVYALSLGIRDSKSWRVEVTTDAEWSSGNLGSPDLLILANVAALNKTQVAEVERLVHAGMGLMVFVGSQVDPDNYNRMLFDGGKGVLPASLDAIVDDPFSGLLLQDASPSPLDSLRQLNPAVLERIAIQKVMALQDPDNLESTVRILARWNNAEGSPAVVEKTVGQGKVLLWTVSADRALSDWPVEPSYVMAVREATKAIARSKTNLSQSTAGETIRYPLSENDQADLAMMKTPDEDELQGIVLQPINDISSDRLVSPEGKKSMVTFADTRQAGCYRLTWQGKKAAKAPSLFAVNPDIRESQLARISADRLEEWFGSLKPEIVSAGADLVGTFSAQGKEVWRTFAIALLGLLACESCFATWVGRQR